MFHAGSSLENKPSLFHSELWAVGPASVHPCLTTVQFPESEIQY